MDEQRDDRAVGLALLLGPPPDEPPLPRVEDVSELDPLDIDLTTPEYWLG